MAGGGDNTVAASVNGKNIPMSEIERALNQQTQGQQAKLSDLELATARLQILDNLIQQEVLFQRAEKDGLLPKDDEVTAALDQAKQASKMSTEQYQKKLQETGQTEAQLREDLRRQLALQKLQERISGKVGTPSDREVEAFYNANKAQFVNARGLGLAAIVVSPQDEGASDDAKSEVEATSKAANIYQQLRNGADFATVARARSEDQSAVNGGDLGFATEAQLAQQGFPRELIAKLFALEVGGITEPVRSSDGRVTIFKLTNKRLQNENLNLDSPGVREEIISGLTEGRKSLRFQLMMKLAMEEAKIKNYLAQRTFDNIENLSGVRPAGANPTASPTAETSSSAATTPNASPSPMTTTTAAPAASPAAGSAR